MFGLDMVDRRHEWPPVVLAAMVTAFPKPPSEVAVRGPHLMNINCSPDNPSPTAAGGKASPDIAGHGGRLAAAASAQEDGHINFIKYKCTFVNLFLRIFWLLTGHQGEGSHRRVEPRAGLVGWLG